MKPPPFAASDDREVRLDAPAIEEAAGTEDLRDRGREE
jgi:hypothetical protein